MSGLKEEKKQRDISNPSIKL